MVFLGLVSGYVGGPGANENLVLSNAIKASSKTIARMAARNCTEYAAKQIASTVAWSNNIITYTTFSSSIKFATGIGITNAVIGHVTKILELFNNFLK